MLLCFRFVVVAKFQIHCCSYVSDLLLLLCFRFAPSLRVKSFIGDKGTRHEMSENIKKSQQGLSYCFDVLVTTYEVKDETVNSLMARTDYSHFISLQPFLIHG